MIPIKSVATALVTSTALWLWLPGIGAAQSAAQPLDPAHMRRIGSVDDRYQSYNYEMIQVMGGKWWAPYPKASGSVSSGASAKAELAGFGGATKLYRPPADLANPKLRKLASALSPALVRVTDTWANTVYFQDTDAAEASPPPPGFGAVITRPQWKGLIDFSNAVGAPIVTSFSIAAGVRSPQGVWTPSEASKILTYTREAGGRIAAAEFYNEPNLGVISGAPKDYDAEAYARDYRVFRTFIKTADPEMALFGPGAVGEDEPLPGVPAGLKTPEILRAVGPTFDGVSYHFYGALSQRCAALGAAYQTSPTEALSPEWLMATTKLAQFYTEQRDRYEPGKPVWLTETADAACGGNPWASDYIDTFRYLNQLGVLAKAGVQVVMHNTLAGSDYGLLDDVTLDPRPNYWAALLWRRLMGRGVLEVGAAPLPNLYIYAQCLRDHPGGVTLLAINADRTQGRDINLPTRAVRYTLTGKDLLSQQVALNGQTLKLLANNDLPSIAGASVRAGGVTLAPLSITFLALPDAANASCAYAGRPFTL